MKPVIMNPVILKLSIYINELINLFKNIFQHLIRFDLLMNKI